MESSPERTRPAIDVRHLRKRYGELAAVDDVSFKVQRGEIFGIIGPNGSGKTTSVECIQGLRMPDSGSVEVLGVDAFHSGGALRHRIGSQLQESALPERIRVWEALDLFGALSPHSRNWSDVAREWGLYEKRSSAFGSLSGGQRQRLFIALALINRPEVVFFDEMTTGLDPSARRDAWDLIRYAREGGATVVLVTHFMDEAEALCDRLAIFRAGRILDVDRAPALIRKHAGQGFVRFTADGDLPWLTEVPGVKAIRHEGARFAIEGAGPLLAYVAAALVAHGIAPPDLELVRPSLEDVFLSLTLPNSEATPCAH